MKTLEELKQFYRTTLIEDLKGLEQERKKVLKRFLYVGLGVACVAVVVLLMLGGRGIQPQFFIIAVAICAVLGGFVCTALSKGYVSNFKVLVIGKIVKFVDESLNYNPRGYIPRSTFVLSKIFTTKPNRYKGDDLVSGKMGATAIEFSELNAVYESGSGKNRHRHTVFKGLFFVGDFNKDFRGWTVVLPDTAERLFGRLGQKLQAMNIFRGQLIKLEDPEFERNFAVYGSDQIEARYILSTSLMSRIVDFKKSSGRKIHLSFVGSRVFVAISYTRSLFEPRIFTTLLDFEPIRGYFEDLQLAVGIVDELNLNTRIWSKE